MQPYFPNRAQQGINNYPWPGLVLGGFPSTQGTPLALDSAYSFGVSGDAIAGAFTLEADRTLTDIYFVCSAKQGAGEINWEIRSGVGRGVNYSPGSTSVASGTVDFSAITADAWCKISGLSVALTKGVYYNLIFGDANGSGTDFVTMRNHSRPAGVCNFHVGQVQTTDGWATAGTFNTHNLISALKFSDGFVTAGSPLRASASLSSSTVLRGIKITLPSSGPAINICGLFQTPSVIGGWTLYVLKGSTSIPTDISSPFWSYTVPAGLDYSNTQITAMLFFSDPLPRLVGGETYYFLFKPDVTSNLPGKTTMWGNMDSDLRKLVSGHWGIDCSFVVEASGSTWIEDTDATAYTSILCSIANQPTLAA